MGKLTMKLFILHHTYCDDFEEETKFLGVYSSETKTKEAIKKYISLPGFNRYPYECFIIGDCILNENANWENGF